MDKRVRERRRHVNRERGRRRAGLIVACVAVLAVVCIFVWLRSSDVFSVERITATRVAHVTEQQLTEATAGARGANLLALSVGPVEEKLAALPYVRSATVHRRFPHTLEVRIEEYTPVARVQTRDGSVWLVSEDGRVLEKKTAPDLPLFIPEADVRPKLGTFLPAELLKALPLASAIQQISPDLHLPLLHDVSIALTGEVVAHLSGGVDVRLGEPAELKQKLTVAATIIQQYLRDGKQLAYVDCSVPDRVAVKQE